MFSLEHLHCLYHLSITESPKHDSIQPLGSSESLMNGVSALRTQVPDDTVLLLLLLLLCNCCS